MAKRRNSRKTLRLKKKRQSRRYRYRGGFADFPNIDINDERVHAFVVDYFRANSAMLAANPYGIETPSQLYLEIRGMQPNHRLYDDLKRKYEEAMMAM
jgi:hypothetical protein